MATRSTRNRSLLAIAGAGVVLLTSFSGGVDAVDADPDAHGTGVDCLRCHEPLREELERGEAHEPASKGECVACHSPHAARFEKLLNQRERALCFSCHEDEKLSFLVGSVHTPVREGQCVVCHDPHASEHGMLLVEEGTELCLRCHDEKRAQMQLAHVHEPLESGECTSCHMPHSSPYPDQLVGDSDRLCRVCHDLDSEKILDAHSGIPVEKTRCTGCHDPHASNMSGMLLPYAHQPFAGGECDLCHDLDGESPLLLVATGGRLCSACHREVPRSKDTVVHAPVGRGECTSCHAAHASAVEGMLVGELQDTCLSCHAELETRYEESRSVHPWGAGGATCAQCHQPHSSKEEHLLNQGPIRTCLVCHETQRHGHPLGDDRLDPRTGKPITCVTCHDVHGTEFPMQLRGDQTRGLCLECHRVAEGGGHGG